MLSAVDNRCDKRIRSDVLDHDPTHADIRAFLGRLKMALSARDLLLLGITTDGSALSPEPLVEVCGDVPHHICEFHIVAEVVKPTFKGSECPYRFCAQRALHTMSGRGPARHRTAGDGGA